MIHYHGLPITPDTACIAGIQSGHAMVSFARPDQLGIAIEFAQTFALDNGAFSAWRSGNPIIDWQPYYAFVESVIRCPGFDFAIIPDVIDGSEEDNDGLVREFPFSKFYGAPVWHFHESITRLQRLANDWPRICLGSSGQYATIGTTEWFDRMDEIMNAITDSQGRPTCKIHGLRMLNPRIFSLYPFSSADSTHIGRSVGIDKKWPGAYTPVNKQARAMVMRGRIEQYQSPQRWEPTNKTGKQTTLATLLGLGCGEP